LTGVVWNDANADGVRGLDEVGIPGVTVVVSGDPDGDGQVETYEVVTNSLGGFSLELPPGEWNVEVDTTTVPFGLAAVTDQTGTVTIRPGVIAEIEFGEAGGSVAGVVWADNDRDGVRDPEESNVQAVRVRLVYAGPDGVRGTGDDMTFETTTTSAGYEFTGVPVGRVGIITIDLGTVPRELTVATYDPDGSLDATTSVMVDTPGGRVDRIDFGYAEPAPKFIPRTGSPTREPLTVGGFLVFTGLALVILAGRRRRESTIQREGTLM
jgi:hypothetical protein